MSENLETITSNAEEITESAIPQEKLDLPIEPAKEFTWQVILMLIVIIVAWATPNVIGKYIDNTTDLEPIQISALRYLPAALTLVIVCLATKRGKQLILDFKEKYIHLIIASLILTSFVLFQMYSVTMINANASSFLLNVNPIITFVLSILVLKERHKWWGALGVFIAFAGVFFIAIPIDQIKTTFSPAELIGSLLAFLSGFAWAAYSVYLKKFLKERDPITTTTWTLGISAVILTIVMFSVYGWFSSTAKYYHYITILFMGIVPTAIAFTLWFETIRRISVQKASVFQFLIPIIATLFTLAMGELITWFFALGGVLIIGGLIIAQKS
ncbi:MAG: DMT family transporter [Candidatus Heimdallarchaeota archaeon]